MIIKTPEDCHHSIGQLRKWCYNALDVTGTREVWDNLRPRMDDVAERIYRFDLATQAPAFAMTLRGVPVNQPLRLEAVKELRLELNRALKALQKIEPLASLWDGTEKDTGLCKAEPGKHHKWPRGVDDSDPAKRCERCGAPRLKRMDFNPGSHPQNQHLFYELLGLPEMKNKQGKVSVDGEILLRIKSNNRKLEPLVDGILNIRDYKKQIGTLNARLRPNNRFGSNFNVAAAWTGRFSSDKDPHKTGGNLQNVSARHRHVFTADPGYEMFYADLKTAESMAVAYEAGDEKYIKAHLIGDPHTIVSALVWPDELEWPEGNPLDWGRDTIKIAKRLAEATIPEWDNKEGHDYRFQAKKQQHGSNYGLTPYGIARLAHIPEAAAFRGQGRYFGEFPHITKWQSWQYQKISEFKPIFNPLGRRFTLMGPPGDKHTKNQALSASPQSLVAMVINIGLWRVWRYGDPELIQLFAQVHDAILGQYRVEKRAEALKFLEEMMTVPVDVTDQYGKTRRMMIAVEIAVGGNWGYRSPKNPNGLVKL